MRPQRATRYISPLVSSSSTIIWWSCQISFLLTLLGINHGLSKWIDRAWTVMTLFLCHLLKAFFLWKPFKLADPRVTQIYPSKLLGVTVNGILHTNSFKFSNPSILSQVHRPMWNKQRKWWGTHVHLWWIHVDVWQNQYNIVK